MCPHVQFLAQSCTRLSVRHATSSTALVAAPTLAPSTGETVASGGGSVVAGGGGSCEGVSATQWVE